MAPAAVARATAAEPSVIPRGTGGPASGFPSQATAAPQWAMPQDGSAVATALKALIASPNQNECCSATARSNCACTAGLHEVGKLTLPNRSGACARACSVDAASDAANTAIPIPTTIERALTI